MLQSINHLLLLGVLDDEPEEKKSKSAYKIVKIYLKTIEWRKLRTGNSEGQWTSEKQIHEIIMFGQVAEDALRILKKGSKVFIYGKIKTNEYEAKNGKMYINTQVICQKFINLSEKSPLENNDNVQEKFQDDEIPF